MTNNEFDEFLDDSLPVEDVKLDMDKVKENVPQFSNEKLCEMIVADRYLGFGKKISIVCMEELAKRRLAGDTFHFESYIDKVQGEMPELNFNMPDLREVLNQAIALRKNNR